MKTLNKEQTCVFFKSDSSYDQFVKRWSEIVNSPEGKTLNSTHFLLYLTLRGKDWQKAFVPGKRMEHYAAPFGYYCAYMGRYAHAKRDFENWFKDMLDPKWLDFVDAVLPSPYKSDFNLEKSYDVENLQNVISKLKYEVRPSLYQRLKKAMTLS